jgi:sterol desaturase/sphingolipid hydroxylase (fatty acid hydroxylase superfamily)
MDETGAAARTTRGPWVPTRPIEYAPLFVWPPQPRRLLRWFAGVPGYVLPFNALYATVAVAVWFLLTPSRSTMSQWSVGWVAFVFARNAVLLVAWYGIFHLRLYVRRGQDARSKFNARFPAARSERFTLGSQTRENVLWSVASGLPIWTAWEVVTLWLFSSGRIGWLEWASDPVWFVALLLLIPLVRELHFYVIHRLIHWPPLYRSVHSLHHRNTNPGPWSGLSMHPVEHLLYFSATALHWIIPSHPIHALYTSFHLMMAPVPGHAGFERIEMGRGGLDTGGYAHYLHHKYFEVNYADGAIPLDRWFGSFHDGTPAGDEAMRRRRLTRAGRLPEADDA